MIYRLLLGILFFTSFVFTQPLVQPETYDTTLDNGLRVIFIKDDYQPILLMDMMINSGSREDETVGTAKLLGSLLSKGTKKTTSSEFSKTKDLNGASIGVNVGYTYIHINMSCLMAVEEVMVSLFKDMILSPRFSPKEFNLLKPQMKVNLEELKTDNDWILNYFATQHYFPENSPFAKQMTINSLETVSLENINRFYSKYFTPRNSTLVVRGKFSIDAMKEKMTHLLTETQPFHSIHKIKTFTRNEEVFETISSIKEVLKDLNKNGFTKEEFDDAKSFYHGYIPSQLESPSTLSQWILFGLHKGLSIKESVNRYSDLLAVNQTAFSPLIETYFKPDEFILVVLGDKDLIYDQLGSFGPIEVIHYTDI